MLRPEPGNAATVERVARAGLTPIACPLFAVAPLAWTPPDPAGFDALLLTSANAVRHGGPALGELRDLPVLAVGGVTAAAARDAGFMIEHVGESDLAALLAGMQKQRLLWLAGEDRTAIDHPAIAETLAVYRAAPLPIAADAMRALSDSVALLHSARAGARFAALLDQHGVARRHVALAGISAKATRAAGAGWRAVTVATTPTDDALIAAARTLAIDP